MIARSWTVPFAAIATVLALSMPAAAQAQYAQTARWAKLRAGPAPDYPLVASFPPGVSIAVQGCVDGYSWCDVIGPAGERGWVYAGNIVYPYQSGYVPVMYYGGAIGIPVVTFVIGNYWGDYYRYRPWYGHMHYWHSHAPAVRRPPPRPRPPPSIQPPRPEAPSVRPPPRPQPQVGRPPPPGNRMGRPGDDRPRSR